LAILLLAVVLFFILPTRGRTPPGPEPDDVDEEVPGDE
jgi:hypothetical protein